MDAAPSTNTPATPLLDVDTAVQRLGGSRDFFHKIADAFRGDAAAQLTALHQQLAADDKAGALRSIHTFKGLAATVGATALAKLAAQTEQTLKSLEEPVSTAQAVTAPLLRTLDQDFALVLDALTTLLQAAAIPPATSEAAPATHADGAVDAASYTAKLQDLSAKLQSGNMQACALCADIRQSCAPHLDARFDALEDSVNRLDFAKALAHCTQLLTPP